MNLTEAEREQLRLPAPTPTKQEKLLSAARRLNEIVEGVRSERWVSDETGVRLKDTKEWCEFYCALADLTR